MKSKLFWLYFGVSVLAVLFLSFKEAMAAPAAPITYTLTQPNGKAFKARTVGDEWNNRTITRDGYTILKDEASGYWVYAQKGSGESLNKSAFKVSIDSPKGIEKGLKPKSRPVLRNIPLPRVQAPSALGQPGPSAYAPPVGSASGSQPVLIILVEFSDMAFVVTDQAAWNASFFGASSSVRDYYDEASYGDLSLVPATESYGTSNDGVVAVVLPYPHPNTGVNTGSANQQITIDALLAADPYVDFLSFDANGSSYLSTNELHIVIVAAGYEGAYGGTQACEPNVWAHHWELGSSAPTLDTVTVGADDYMGTRYYGGYVQMGELHGIKPVCGLAHMATIGIMAHELGHDLWLPDMYDIDDNDIAGIGDWGLMGSGSWNYLNLSGDSPAHPTPWDKWYEGWLTPIQIAVSQSVSMPQVETNSVVYQLVDNPGGVDWSFYGSSGTGEYFLVENRQQTGYDRGLPDCGVLIWHIDETVAYDNTANANERGRRLVALEQADGFFQLEVSDESDIGNTGDSGDPYRAGNSFDATTIPNSSLYDGGASGVSISIIDDCGTNMTVDLSLCDLQTYYGDADGDSYGDPNETSQACVGSPPGGYVDNKQDCDDNIYSVNPGAPELCDGIDNDCDGEIDEIFSTTPYYRDEDEDTYGNPAVSVEACVVPSGYVANSGDCDDTDSTIYSGASEICDGVDNDCDGQIDESLLTFTYYSDADSDSYGDSSVSIQDCSLTPPSGYVNNDTDCNDANSTVYPGAAEVCDGLDNNCNGVVDDGGLADNDGDGLCDEIDQDDDNDGLPDTWESSNGFDPLDPNDAAEDPDGDGFTNLQEYEREWDPNHASTIIYADVKTTAGTENGTASYPFDTITEAIAAAYSGDAIWVDTGTYHENINFNGKTLVLVAETGAEGTIIHGGSCGAVVTFENGEGPYTELNGFIIKDGNGSIGGGIAVLNGSAPLIVNNIIVSNVANYGGGIGCNASSPTIMNNTIVDNDSTAIGDGIYCIDTTSPTVTNTILWNNGNEIYLDNGASITVTYSDVEGGYSGTGNINADPLFVDAANEDYHLQAGSPCIDSGITPADGIPADDMDGDDRPQEAGYDIGADEYVDVGAGGSGEGQEESGGAATSAPTSAGNSGGGGGGCFIATAAYGTPMAQQVKTLNRFRDQYLLTTAWGRKFVTLYYKYSPPLANYIADKDGLRLVVRICLVPLLLLALFMVKLGLAGKLLVVGSLLSLPIAWRVLTGIIHE